MTTNAITGFGSPQPRIVEPRTFSAASGEPTRVSRTKGSSHHSADRGPCSDGDHGSSIGRSHMTESVTARSAMSRRLVDSVSTPRRALAAAAKGGGTGVLIAGLVGGCSSATTTPDATPSYVSTPAVATAPGTMPSMETPGYTITPAPTATVKVEASPTVNPDALTTAKLGAQIQSGEAKTLYPNIKAADLTTLFNALVATKPSIGTDIFKGQGPTLIKDCTTSKDPAVQEVDCYQLLKSGTQVIAQSDSPQAEAFVKGVAGYGTHNLTNDQLDWIVAYLQK